MLLVALCGALPPLATAQVAILQIQVVQGDGAVWLPDARSQRPLTVQVTDETGRPVEGAAVSFHLPEEGPGAIFANGLRTDIATTDNRGRATLRGLHANRTPGRFQIRVVASKEQARAGTVVFQYVADTRSQREVVSGAPRSAPSVSRGVLKWVVVAALAGGAAALVVVASGRSGGATSGSGATPVTTLTIGAPSLTVGKP